MHIYQPINLLQSRIQELKGTYYTNASSDEPSPNWISSTCDCYHPGSSLTPARLERVLRLYFPVLTHNLLLTEMNVSLKHRIDFPCNSCKLKDSTGMVPHRKLRVWNANAGTRLGLVGCPLPPARTPSSPAIFVFHRHVVPVLFSIFLYQRQSLISNLPVLYQFWLRSVTLISCHDHGVETIEMAHFAVLRGTYSRRWFHQILIMLSERGFNVHEAMKCSLTSLGRKIPS